MSEGTDGPDRLISEQVIEPSQSVAQENVQIADAIETAPDVTHPQTLDLSARVSGRLIRLKNGQLADDLSATAELSRDTSVQKDVFRLSIRNRLRDRFRTEQQSRFSPDGDLLSTQTLEDQRDGDRQSISGVWEADRGRGLSFNTALLYDKETSTQMRSEPTFERLRDRQTFKMERLQSRFFVENDIHSSAHLDLRLSTDNQDEERRILLDPNGDDTAFNTAQTLDVREANYTGHGRYTRNGRNKQRLRFEMHATHQSRRSQLTETATTIPLSMIDVERLRLEPGVGLRRELADDLTGSAKLELEANRIATALRTESQTRWFTDVKPTFSLTGKVDDGPSWRTWMTRSVSPIDLEDFTTNFDEVDIELQDGNSDIRPQKSWEYGAELSQRISPLNAKAELTLEYHDISDLIDFIATDEGRTIRGNLGSGQAYHVDADLDFKLDTLGLEKSRLSFGYEYVRSSVFDPKLGEERLFSETPEHRYSVRYEQPINLIGAKMEVEAYAQSQQITVEADRIDLERQTDPVVDLTLDWRLASSRRISLGVGNLLSAADVRERTRFRGLVGSSSIRRLENRTRAPGRILSVEISADF